MNDALLDNTESGVERAVVLQAIARQIEQEAERRDEGADQEEGTMSEP